MEKDQISLERLKEDRCFQNFNDDLLETIVMAVHYLCKIHFQRVLNKRERAILSLVFGILESENAVAEFVREKGYLVEEATEYLGRVRKTIFPITEGMIQYKYYTQFRSLLEEANKQKEEELKTSFSIDQLTPDDLFYYLISKEKTGTNYPAVVLESGYIRSTVPYSVESYIVKRFTSHYLEEQGLFVRSESFPKVVNLEEQVEDDRIELPVRENEEKKMARENLKVEAYYHPKFPIVYKLVRDDLPVFLSGPAGCGKTMTLEQIAQKLNLPIYKVSTLEDKSDLFGWMDATGNYHPSVLYGAVREGGLFFLDDIDRLNPNTLLNLNSLLEVGGPRSITFPMGQVTPHPNFRFVAAANTWGEGANSSYVGRNKLDAATLNRFVQVRYTYDRVLEREIVEDEELLTFLWGVRNAYEINGIHQMISTRNFQQIRVMLDAGDYTPEEICSFVLEKNKPEDYKRVVEYFDRRENSKNMYCKVMKKQYARV